MNWHESHAAETPLAPIGTEARAPTAVRPCLLSGAKPLAYQTPKPGSAISESREAIPKQN